MSSNGPQIDKFMAHVKVDESGCWLWQGSIAANGYGQYGSKTYRWAHRAGYLFFRGPIPSGLTIDHLCRVKSCVNPDHLEPVTQRENSRRALPWTKCSEYHPASPSRFVKRGDGRDYCRECNRVREQQRRDSQALRAANALDPWATNGEGPLSASDVKVQVSAPKVGGLGPMTATGPGSGGRLADLHGCG